ncbi:MarR family transcriptional regulator [Clostridioides sp. ES-S-0145-01]|nr:MarR family transcriptional regulator [Clostridioides sp. ES-S-0049-03]MCC0674396.1 MarR family transcriptional regulator [Clostridioides sp. ES-S-0145-01]MCC0678059.1 MarR family transcriptional regulator [Clostridioides sp. ES-W-0018-02]MCC0712569.1 MarR family transcriptional regulator [Clostridioides sp. ES-W-0017-02]
MGGARYYLDGGIMRDFEKLYEVTSKLISTSLKVKEDLKKMFKQNGYDITTDHYALLRFLWEQDGISQIDLCEKSCKDKSNTTRILDVMKNKGLIVRKVDVKDRRKFQIFLTDVGRKLEEPLNKIADVYATETFKTISDEELSLFTEALDKLSK